MEEKFYEHLELVKTKRSDLIEASLEVSEECGVSYFFRHGGISEVINKGAPPGVVELNGRWRKSNQSGARKPNITIREHYIDIRLVLDQLLEFF